MSFDQAQAQAEFEYEQNRDAINDDFRRWQTSMMYGGRGTSGTGGTATPQEDSFDINPYMDRIENGGYLNDPQALIQYINTRDIPESAKQQLRNLYGVTQRTSDLGVSGQTRPEYKYEAITPKVEPEPVDYPMSYVEAKEDVLSTATDMNGNVNAEIVAQQVDALVAAGQISPDVARAIYSPYAQQE